MFNFRNTTIVFTILALLLMILLFSGIYVHYFYFLVLSIVYLVILFTASFFIESGFYMNAICKRETRFKVVALTFDDGPDPESTPLMLDILKDRAKATFFCIGKKIDGNEELLKRMNDEGHLIGMHSYSHSNWFSFFTPSRIKSELQKTENKISGVIGKKPLLFRPPFGVINPSIKKALSFFPYHVIGFNNRSLDTVINDKKKIILKIMNHLEPGNIILFHDTVANAPDLLKSFLTAVSDKGYIVVCLDEMLNIQAYEE